MPEITVTEHLLSTQKTNSPHATGQFTALLHDLIVSAKIISRNVKQAGLVDILGGTGEVNVQGERVQKLDEFANNVLIYRGPAARCARSVPKSWQNRCFSPPAWRTGREGVTSFSSILWTAPRILT